MSEWVQLTRFAFARGNLVRRVANTARTCDWCGQRTRHLRLFRYGFESDGGRRSEFQGQFCSKGCAEAYHGGSLVQE